MSSLRGISIRAKISIAISFLVAAVSLFIYLYFPPRLQEEATNAIVEKGESIASMTAYALVPAIAFEDPKAIQEVFEAAKQNKDLLYLVVCNDSGRVLLGYNLERANEVSYKQNSDFSSSSITIYKTSSHIVVGNRSIGTLYLGLSLEWLQQRIAGSERIVALVSLIVFFLGLVIAYIVSTILTKPLRRVVEAVEQISEGNILKRAEIVSRDEVGALAKSFNTMVDTLVETQNQLEDMNRSLEERVQRRTSELQMQIDQHERTKNILQRREMIIGAVSSVTEQFLGSESWETNLGSVLEVLGRAANVSRAYVFKTESGEHGLRLSLFHEWCAEGIVTRMGNPSLNYFEFRSIALYRMEKMLMEGKTVQGTFSALPEQAKRSFLSHNVVSIIAVPIFVAKKWWGVIGFDECIIEKEWMSAEIDALTTAARNLGSAIEREIAVKALSVSEERYRKFFDNDLTGDFIVSSDGKIIDCNTAFAQMFGFRSPDDALTTNLANLFSSPASMRELWTLLNDKKSLTYHELSLRRTDDHTVHVVANLIGSFEEGGGLSEVRGYLFDDTRRKELEQQLLHAQKMESIGTLAGGIAHDFNNILAIIIGHATLLSKGEIPKEKFGQSFQIIEKTAQRGVSLVKQLLAFARKTDTRMELVDLNAIVSDTVKMLAETFPKSITVQKELAKGLPFLFADSTQVGQVLLNLCVNARDAMSASGVITIGTRMVGFDQLRHRYPNMQNTSYAELTVSDTGEGMSAEILSKIFEPFFTTKKLGKGTGLGLSVVFGIVENHKGVITVESHLGAGTTFHVYFPAEETGATVIDIEKGSPEEIQRGTGTILFVEDEELLRFLVDSELSKLGYQIISASDGEEGFAMYEKHASEIDLVLSDMGLPKLNGEHLFYRLREKNKNLKMIIASGFLDPDTIGRLRNAGITDLIDKPYEMSHLVQHIQSALQ